MTRRTVLRGLVDLPFDWLLLPWASAFALAQLTARFPGERVVKVRGVTQSVSGVSAGVQVRERLLLTVLVTAVVFVFPAIVRRSARAWRGRRGQGEQFLFDAPFHRDPLFWLAVLFLVSGISSGSNFLPHLDPRQSSWGFGQPVRQTYEVSGSYGSALAALAITGVFVLVPVAIAAAVRGWYRRLGEPSGPRRRWWGRSDLQPPPPL